MNATILYIEDSELNIRLIKKMLKVMEYNLISAEDGQSGIEVAKEISPDIILLDIHLPDIDGYEVLRQLRNDSSIHNIARTPIIALTADPNNYGTCREAGFDGYLNKPVSRGTLLRTVLQFLSNREQVSRGDNYDTTHSTCRR